MIPTKPNISVAELDEITVAIIKCKEQGGKDSIKDLCWRVGPEEKLCESQKLLLRAGLNKDVYIWACGEKYNSPDYLNNSLNLFM